MEKRKKEACEEVKKGAAVGVAVGVVNRRPVHNISIRNKLSISNKSSENLQFYRDFVHGEHESSDSTFQNRNNLDMFKKLVRDEKVDIKKIHNLITKINTASSSSSK